MMDTKFKEWLLDQEFGRLVEAVCAVFMLKEGNSEVDAAMISNNAELSRLFGIQKNWFGILLGAATKYAKGQDALGAASDAATEIIQGIRAKNEADPFYQGIAPLLQMPEGPDKERQITAYFTNAGSIRVRRLGTQFTRRKSDQQTKAFSVLDRQDIGGRSIDQIEDGGSDMQDPQARMDSMRRRIIMELEREKQKATHPDAIRRWELAKKVAEKRWENPPDFPSLDELAGMFPDVSRGLINKILGEIQEVSQRVAAEMGVNMPASRYKKA
jgi:hypothetical protein